MIDIFVVLLLSNILGVQTGALSILAMTNVKLLNEELRATVV